MHVLVCCVVNVDMCARHVIHMCVRLFYMYIYICACESENLTVFLHYGHICMCNGSVHGSVCISE